MELTYNDWSVLSQLCTTTGVPSPIYALLYDSQGQQIYNIPRGIYITTTLAIMESLVERVYGS